MMIYYRHSSITLDGKIVSKPEVKAVKPWMGFKVYSWGQEKNILLGNKLYVANTAANKTWATSNKSFCVSSNNSTLYHAFSEVIPSSQSPGEHPGQILFSCRQCRKDNASTDMNHWSQSPIGKMPGAEQTRDGLGLWVSITKYSKLCLLRYSCSFVQWSICYTVALNERDKRVQNSSSIVMINVYHLFDYVAFHFLLK